MMISPFKLGLGLVIVGIIWVSFIFDETEKIHDSILLKQSNSFELKDRVMSRFLLVKNICGVTI